MLQLRERRERQQGGLPLLALVGMHGLSALEDGHVLAPAGAMGVDVGHLPRQRPVDQAEYAGLGGQARHVHVLL